MSGTSFNDGEYPLKDEPKPSTVEKKTESVDPSKRFKSILKEVTKNSGKTSELTKTFRQNQNDLSYDMSENAQAAIDSDAPQEKTRESGPLLSSEKETLQSETLKTTETREFIETLKESIAVPYLALTMIFDRLQSSILQLAQSKGAETSKLLIFKTEMGDAEKLRIELKEKDGKWILKLGATEDLQLLIREALPALAAALKEKGYDCEDIFLEAYQDGEDGNDDASDSHQEEADEKEAKTEDSTD